MPSVDEVPTFNDASVAADPAGSSDPYAVNAEYGEDPYGGYGDDGYASTTVVRTLSERHTFENFTLGIDSDIYDSDNVVLSSSPCIRVWTEAADGTRTAVVSQSVGMFFRPLIRFSEAESAFYFVSYAGSLVYGEDLVFEPTLYRIDAKGIRTKNLPRLVFEGPIPEFVSRYEMNLFSAPGVSVFKVTTLIRVSRDEDETRERTFVEHLRLDDFD